MKFILLILIGLVMAGCYSIETQTRAIDHTVPAVATGADCSPIILGIGFGTNTVQRATLQKRVPDVWESAWWDPRWWDTRYAPFSIVKIRSVAVLEQQALLFGQRCVVVTGH